MTSYGDKTSRTTNRTLINFQRPEVENVLPEYFRSDFPNIKKFFDAYYNFLDSDKLPGGKIKNLYKSRDATEAPEELLQFLEDELLLGQAYFGGFQNKREAIKFSNYLYRSKGTKYSIEQFFRGFFGEDPEIIYPKENIFKVGPIIDLDLDSLNTSGQQIREAASQLGPESQRFLTDDKRFQVLSILIKSGVNVSEWLEAYKLFVHPAGAHIAAEIVLELVNGNVIANTRESGPGDQSTFTSSLEVSANMNLLGFQDVTLIEKGDGTIGMLRTNPEAVSFVDNSGTVFDSTSPITYRQLMSPNSFTFDAERFELGVNGFTEEGDLPYTSYASVDPHNTVNRFRLMFGASPYNGTNTCVRQIQMNNSVAPLTWTPTGDMPSGSAVSFYQVETDYTNVGFDSSKFVNPEHIVGKAVNNPSAKVANWPGLIIRHPTNDEFAYRIDSDVNTTYDTSHPNAPFGGPFSGSTFAVTLMVPVPGTPITMDRDSNNSPLFLSTFDEGRYQTLFDSARFKTPFEDYNAANADSAHYPFGGV